MPENCSNCHYGHVLPWQSTDVNTGEIVKGENTFCRFDPPEFIPPATSTLKPAPPNGWCGKWARSTAKQPKRGKAS